MAWGFRGRPARINRWEASILLAVYAGYTACLILSAL
jgi:hypothetical protein